MPAGESTSPPCADSASIGLALRCYVRSEAPAAGDGSRLRPLWVRVVLTADDLRTVHEEPVSLPAVLAPELPAERGRRYVVYSVLDAVLASTFDALEALELTLDALAARSGRSASSTPTSSRSSIGSTSRSTTCLRRSTRPRTVWACCSTSSSTSARIS